MATVTNETEFRTAIANSDPEIIVANNISLTAQTTIGYAVTIRGASGVSLLWASPTAARPNMFILTATGALTVESIILDAERRDGNLVQVNGGTFTMNDGAILRNIYGRTAKSAVTLGAIASPSYGTFIMNGGLITGVETSSAVFCSGGTIIMNNDAAISDNMSSGLNMVDAGGVRSSLTMTGRSRISGNQSTQGGSGGIILGTDVVMGVNEGDAPAVTGNHEPVYSTGGLLMGDCTLTMRYNAEISDNDAAEYGGGLVVYGGTTISMRDNAAIKNNKAGTFGGGLLLGSNSTVTMEDNAQISGNMSGVRGGGIELQNSSLEMKGNASIYGNTSASGAGIVLNVNSSASIGVDNSSPKIYENIATNRGGGIFIVAGCRLDLTGNAQITDNVAAEGKGVYKMGTLNLSESPQILDGLFFDDLDGFIALSFKESGVTVSDAKLKLLSNASEAVEIKLPFTANAIEENAVAAERVSLSDVAIMQAYTDNVPIIVQALTTTAHIQLESSGYVSPPNVPLVIADKGPDYGQLVETDRAAWRIPTDFGSGYSVILNAELNQVLIVFQSYTIRYEGLYGATHSNPETYVVSDLPITLSAPENRPGYAFRGWIDSNGQRVTEITADMAGDITLTAVWEAFTLAFNGNAPRVCNIPKAMPAEKDGRIKIPTVVPCRPCHHFICWNIPDSGSGRAYFPGDTISISDTALTLYAQWQPDCCHCQDKRKEADGASQIKYK